MGWPHWDVLFNGEAAGSSPKDVRRWWQDRRIPYNLLVGIVGIITWLLVLIAGSTAVKPGEDFEEPFAMILGPPAYAVLANICYSFGPLIDFLIGSTKPSKKLFKAGLGFSLVLTALPGAWALYAWLLTVITEHKLE